MPSTDLVQQQEANGSAEISVLSLMRDALAAGASPESMQQLVALQQSMERFAWEREERQSRIDFDDALVQCQVEIGNIAPNRARENNIMWADYLQIDRKIRPIYTKAGFSISYSEAPAPPGKVKVVATLSRSGISRTFEQMITAAGNPKMSQPDIDASANARCQRYLVLKIFNIAIGIDKDEQAPFEVSEEMQGLISEMLQSKDQDSLRLALREAKKKAMEDRDYLAMKLIDEAWDRRKQELSA